MIHNKDPVIPIIWTFKLLSKKIMIAANDEQHSPQKKQTKR
jgi:hypothetical protein